MTEIEILKEDFEGEDSDSIDFISQGKNKESESLINELGNEREKFLSDEQDEEKATNKCSNTKFSTKIENKYNECQKEEKALKTSIPLKIEDFVPKDSPLYKHLECGKTYSFQYFENIGKGGFGSVVRAMHIFDNNIYAIKKIKLHLGIDQDVRDHKVFREVQAMTMVNHVNVVRYFTSWLELVDKEEQEKERRKMKKRYNGYRKTIRNTRLNRKKLEAEEIKEIREDSASLSPYGHKVSSIDDSDSNIEWESNNKNDHFPGYKDFDLNNKNKEFYNGKMEISQSDGDSIFQKQGNSKKVTSFYQYDH